MDDGEEVRGGDGGDSDGGLSNNRLPPETIAHRYQLEVLDIAKERNTIVYLRTGGGKTLIAVLLLKAFSNLVCYPQQSVCIFLVPTINLASQQAKVIKQDTGMKVGLYTGDKGMDMWQLQTWEEEIKKQEVLVMTAQVLLNNLYHAYIKIEEIRLLIFDECHHCQKEHPYSCIMKDFYHQVDLQKRPRIFGMTASPIIGGFNGYKFNKDIHALECLLDAKIYTTRNRADVDLVVPLPTIDVRSYTQVDYEDLRLKSYLHTLDCLKIKAIERLPDENAALYKKRRDSVTKTHRDLEYCLYDLGLWCTKFAAELLCRGDKDLPLSLESSGRDTFLREAFIYLSSVIPEGEMHTSLGFIDQAFVSNKVAALAELLSLYRDEHMKCILFVERIIVGMALAGILSHMRNLTFLQCEFICGSQTKIKGFSRKGKQAALDDFHSGKVNLLVATNVAEEGLDIRSCSLVVRFDLPKTVRSFIQSRGRARQKGSKYILLLERGNRDHQRFLEHLIISDGLMESQVLESIDSPLDTEFVAQPDMEKFGIERTGSILTTSYSVSLLHQFCSKLKGDQFFHSSPRFLFFPAEGGIQCEISLPVNAPIRNVVGRPCSSSVMAKKVACLEACRILHSVGALNDYLLPCKEEDNRVDNTCMLKTYAKQASKSDMELHSSVVPNELLWQETDNNQCIYLYAYFLKFQPVPKDRDYANFALFVLSPLPKDAAHLVVKLQLTHGRVVISQLTPCGKVVFDVSQVSEAKVFQKLLFGIMIDRKMPHPFPSSWSAADVLSNEGFCNQGRWYLLLPVLQNYDEKFDNGLQVDWHTVKKVINSCLGSSSNFFLKGQTCGPDKFFSKSKPILHFANGMVSPEEVLGSLIVTTHNSSWFCIIEVLYDICANSEFPESVSCSYADYFKNKHGLLLVHPEQPMLKAKPLKKVHNLLTDRSSTKKDISCPKEICVELPPELCQVVMFGLSNALVNTAALLPSVMYRLESILIASQLRQTFSAAFPEGSRVSVGRVLEALTTEKCSELFSLERLELLGDSFLKFAVTCYLFLAYDKMDEGYLASKRSEAIRNTTLHKLGVKFGLPGYVRDSFFKPEEWMAPGHPCKVLCNDGNENAIHGIKNATMEYGKKLINCSKGHQWIQTKTISDVVEALIGAYLVDGDIQIALAFMKWLGLEVDYWNDLISRISKSTTTADKAYIQRFDLKHVEKLLGYEFRHEGLLIEAFTHPSFHDAGNCYQRLEFLGDAVLDYMITEHLYKSFRDLKPGQLTDLRSATVNNEKFAHIAVQTGLHLHLLQNSLKLSQSIDEFVSSTQQTGIGIPDEWDGPNYPKVLSDIIESLVGALFVDTGFNLDKVWEVLNPILQPIVTPECLQIHPVRELQELCQQNQFPLDFCGGKQMEARIKVKEGTVIGFANSTNKISAKRLAACDALCKMKSKGFEHPRHGLIRVIESLDNGKKAEGTGKANVSAEASVAEKIYMNAYDVSHSSRNFVAHNKNIMEVDHEKNALGIEPTTNTNMHDIPSQLLGEGKYTFSRLVDKTAHPLNRGKTNQILCRQIFFLNTTNALLKADWTHKLCRIHIHKDFRNYLNSSIDLTFYQTSSCGKELTFEALCISSKESSSLPKEETCFKKTHTELETTKTGSQSEFMINSSYSGIMKIDNLRAINAKNAEIASSLEDGSMCISQELPYFIDKKIPDMMSRKSVCIEHTQKNSTLVYGSDGHNAVPRISRPTFGEAETSHNHTEIEKNSMLDVQKVEIYPPSLHSTCQESSNADSGFEIISKHPVQDEHGEVRKHHNTSSYVSNPTSSEEEPLERHDKLMERFVSMSQKAVAHNQQKRGIGLISSSANQASTNAEDCLATTSVYFQGEPRSVLHERCIKHNWKFPEFSCFKEEGMPHNKLFTYCATLTLPGIGFVRAEGEPMKNSRLAKDSAAQCLLLWLKEECYD